MVAKKLQRSFDAVAIFLPRDADDLDDAIQFNQKIVIQHTFFFEKCNTTHFVTWKTDKQAVTAVHHILHSPKKKKKKNPLNFCTRNASSLPCS
jgi:hypothetical protein